MGLPFLIFLKRVLNVIFLLIKIIKSIFALLMIAFLLPLIAFLLPLIAFLLPLIAFLLPLLEVQAVPLTVHIDTSGIADKSVKVIPDTWGGDLENAPLSEINRDLQVKNGRINNSMAAVVYKVLNDMGGDVGTCNVFVETGTMWPSGLSELFLSSYFAKTSGFQKKDTYTCSTLDREHLPKDFSLSTAIVFGTVGLVGGGVLGALLGRRLADMRWEAWSNLNKLTDLKNFRQALKQDYGKAYKITFLALKLTDLIETEASFRKNNPKLLRNYISYLKEMGLTNEQWSQIVKVTIVKIIMNRIENHWWTFFIAKRENAKRSNQSVSLENVQTWFKDFTKNFKINDFVRAFQPVYSDHIIGDVRIFLKDPHFEKNYVTFDNIKDITTRIFTKMKLGVVNINGGILFFSENFLPQFQYYQYSLENVLATWERMKKAHNIENSNRVFTDFETKLSADFEKELLPEFEKRLKQFDIYNDKVTGIQSIVASTVFSLLFMGVTFGEWFAAQLSLASRIIIHFFPVADSKNISKHMETPTGKFVLSDQSLTFYGPSGAQMLARKEIENKPEQIKQVNPSNLPILFLLPESPTSAEMCYDSEKKATNFIVGTSQGAKIIQVNDSGIVTEKSKTLFQGNATTVVGAYDDQTQKKCSTSFVVEHDDGNEFMKYPSVYSMKDTSKTVSAKTTENDFLKTKLTTKDKFENIYYADYVSPILFVIQKNNNKTMTNAGLPFEAALVKPLTLLPNGHFLASTKNGLFYSNVQGIFSAVPKKVLGNLNYDNYQIFWPPENPGEQKVGQNFKIIFYSSPASKKTEKGIRIVTVSMDKNEDTLDSFQTIDIFPNKYFVRYDSEPLSVLTMADDFEAAKRIFPLADTEDKYEPYGKVDVDFTSTSSWYLPQEGNTPNEVVDFDFGPEENSKFLFFSLKTKGLLQVNIQTSAQKIIRPQENYKKVKSLLDTHELLLVQDEKLSIADSKGKTTIQNDFSFDGKKIKGFYAEFNEENQEELIILGTTAGVYFIKKKKDFPVYEKLVPFLTDMGITSVRVDLYGKLILTSDESSQKLESDVGIWQLNPADPDVETLFHVVE